MAKTLEVFFEPVDNLRLANLCGVLDENLRQIENAFDIAIARRGEQFTLQGHPAQVLRGEMALKHFYALADKDLSRDEVQLGLIEIASKGEAAQPAPVLLTRRTELHGRTPRQVDYLRNIQDFDITFGIGPAGTGKTYLAVACAVDALERQSVQRIILTRPAVEAGERLGFLPGDLREKVDPYLRPLYDALEDMIPGDKLKAYMEQHVVEIVPLAYMRGRTLHSAFVILDEAQNATTQQMKMFLTRLGANSRAIITGDITQIDLPSRAQSGLIQARDILEGVEGIGFVYFDRGDVVRHRLVKDIIEAYERYHEAEEAPQGPAR